MYFSFHLVLFKLFEQISFHFDFLRFFVAFGLDEFGLLAAQLEQVLRELELGLQLVTDALLELLKLQHVLLLYSNALSPIVKHYFKFFE